MANKTKGEVTISHEGKDYTLVFDFNAFADFEEETGVDNALTLLEDPSALGARLSRALFWSGLKTHHPEITLEEAGRVMTSSMGKLGEALLAAFPQGGDEGNDKPAKRERR